MGGGTGHCTTATPVGHTEHHRRADTSLLLLFTSQLSVTVVDFLAESFDFDTMLLVIQRVRIISCLSLTTTNAVTTFQETQHWVGVSFRVCAAAQPLLQGLHVCCFPPGDLRLEPGPGATVGDREPRDREPGASWLLNTQRGRLPGTRWTPHA